MPFLGKMRMNEIRLSGFRRYLLYAVGEILLVMIGILLALEVSNRSDNRKERALEKELLDGILIGLRSDSSDMAFNLEHHKQILNSQKIVLAWLYSTTPFSDSLKRHIARAHAFTVFTSMDGPYEMLKTSGPQLIQNQEIRNKISKLYDNTYDIYGEREQIYNTIAMESYTRINGSLFYGTIPYQLDKSEITIGEMEPLNPTALRTSKEFSHQMKTLLAFNELIVNASMVPTNRKVNALIQIVKKELDKK